MAALRFGICCSNKSAFPVCRPVSFSLCDATSLRGDQPCQVESNGPTSFLNCQFWQVRAGIEWVQNPTRCLAASPLPLWHWWWRGKVSGVHRDAQMNPVLLERWIMSWKGCPTWGPPMERFRGKISLSFLLLLVALNILSQTWEWAYLLVRSSLWTVTLLSN